MGPTAKILITDPVDAVCANFLQKHNFHVDQIKLSKEQLLENIKNYDGLIVRSETKVTSDILAAATNLKVVGRAGTGVDNVDLDSATKMGILVMNTPGGNTLSAAEHTCALVCSMARHIPQACESLKRGAWDRKLYSGNELSGKTLAIIGLGRIGKEVALRMQSYGMTTIGFDPIIPASASAEFGVEWMELEKIWPLADYITVHVPLIPQTKHLINDETFKKCKPGVKVVNVARGGIIEEESILRNLKTGLCGGAALDVFVEEPPKAEYYKELLAHPKVVCTPHLGASTSEAQLRVAEEIAEQFVGFFSGQSLLGAVNAGSLPVAMSKENKPWLILARSMGIFASFWDGKIKATLGSELGSFIPVAVGSGYLCGKTNNPKINLISAPALIKEKGMEVAVVKAENVGSKEIHLSVGTVSLKGFLGDSIAFLTEIDGATFPGGVPLDGSLVLFKNAKNLPTSFGTIENAIAAKKLKLVSMYRSANGNFIITRVADDCAGTSFSVEGLELVGQRSF